MQSPFSNLQQDPRTFLHCSFLFANPWTQAGLNLNIFAGLSGAFSGKKKTSKNTQPDGSSTETIEEQGAGHARGVGAGSMNANAAAQAQQGERHRKAAAVEQQDHLGIEAPK